MAQWFLSSSVLILIMMGLRLLLKGRISLRLQYGLWALVLVRLLIPFDLPANEISIQNIMIDAPVEEMAQIRLPARSYADAYAQVLESYESRGVEVLEIDPSELDAQVTKRMKSEITLGQALTVIWITGAAVVMGIMIWSNTRFRKGLSCDLRRLHVPWVSLPVYVSQGLDVPCIFGFFHPAIYLTEDIVGDGTRMRHILEHEMTHYFHRDHVFAPLRCLVLALHWFNPLVWWAVGVSRRDGELACDEGTILRIGEAERLEYGRTLIHLTCERVRSRDYVLAATTIIDDKNTIKERIVMIAKKPRTALYTLLIVIAITIFAIGCTFTEASETIQPTDPPSTEPQVQIPEIILPQAGEPDVLMDPLFGVQQAGDELQSAAAQAVLEGLEPGEKLVSCETKVLTRQWYYHTLCQTDYELETADGTKKGTAFSMWYPYTNGAVSKQMLLAWDTDPAFVTGQWWRDRLLPEPTAEYPDFIYLPHADSHGVITALPQDRPIYCAVRGEVEFWLNYRLWTMFPGEGAEAWLTDNVPVDLGREEGYYVCRLEYYIADHNQVYAFRDYLVIQRQTDWTSGGKDWIFHGILTEDELRTYGIDPTTIQEAEPAPYVDDCR